jgi:hypothetical protein
MEAFERTALRVITTVLAKKSLRVSKSEAEELRKLLLMAKNSNFRRPWVSELTDLLEDQSHKQHSGQRMLPKRQLLRVLQQKLRQNLNFEDDSGLFLRPDKEETEIVSERVPRVDVYEGSKSEILRIVQTLVPVIIMSREGSVIDKKGRIVLGAERGALTGEILDLAAECSDCIVMDLAMASQVENLAILKRKRSKFRYVILYGERDKDAATRVSCALMA